MDGKEIRHRSLTAGRCRAESSYAAPLPDMDDRRAATQRSHSSSETLRTFEQDGRPRYGGRVVELLRHEPDEYVMPGSFTLAELGVCETPAQRNACCSELSLPSHGYSLSAGSDADSDPEGPGTPERAVQLWSGPSPRSCPGSGLSSPEHSALTLTDSENEPKTDDESEC